MLTLYPNITASDWMKQSLSLIVLKSLYPFIKPIDAYHQLVILHYAPPLSVRGHSPNGGVSASVVLNGIWEYKGQVLPQLFFLSSTSYSDSFSTILHFLLMLYISLKYILYYVFLYNNTAFAHSSTLLPIWFTCLNTIVAYIYK